MNCFEQGWMHAELGKLLKQCPYKRGSTEWLTWRNGYKAFYEAYGPKIY
jgi:hypothetical protein